MRWAKLPRPDGLKQIVFKFLWLPLTINGETRWLEYATVERRWYCGQEWSCWNYVQFIDGYAETE